VAYPNHCLPKVDGSRTERLPQPCLRLPLLTNNRRVQFAGRIRTDALGIFDDRVRYATIQYISSVHDDGTATSDVGRPFMTLTPEMKLEA
jgi:hypothetical protein